MNALAKASTFAADIEAKFAAIARSHPQLLDAVPPVPIERRPGTSSRFNVDEYWGDLCRRATRGEWKLRAPADSFDGVGPFKSHGACLIPLLTEGRLDYYDPRLPAMDEDVVLIRWDPLELQEIHERNAGYPWWVAMYPEPNPIATKILKAVGGEYFLVTNGSMLRLGDNQILGVLRRSIPPPPSAKFPAASQTVSIIPHAATLVESVEDDSVSLTNGGGVVLSDSLSALGIDYLLQITASFDVWITNTGGGTPEFYLAAINSGGTIQQSQSAFPTASASPGQRITLQVEVPITTADEATTIFAQLNWTGAQPSGTAEVRNAAMRSEQIKR